MSRERDCLKVVGAPPRSTRHSISSGDVVLSQAPPYNTQPWLAMGLVVHAALLGQAGMRARIVRPIDPPFLVPAGVMHASNVTMTRDPPIDHRMAAMDREYSADPAFFDGIVDELAAGGERVVGLSVWRNNVDVTLKVAKLLKARHPRIFIVLGGPEAIDGWESLQLPWIDAVLGVDAERVLARVVEALLAGRPEDAAGLPNVWLNRDLGVNGTPRRAADDSALTLPHIDYGALLPLLVGDAEPTMPLLLNWGCPYRCGFCSNRNVYSRFTPGQPQAIVDQLDAIVTGWVALHDGDAPGITLQLSDATTNALPAQLDEVLVGVADRSGRWGTKPLIRGQTLFDSRITDERVRLMVRSGFRSTFFGLETASDRLRRALGKPGTIAQVADAMQTFHRGRGGELHFGIPVGIPGETDDDFRETERFIEWALQLEGTVASITVLPYMFFDTAQDPELGRRNRGERRGALWRTDAPGGDPAVRARRFMRLFDLVDGRVPVTCPFPPYLLLPAMLPDEDPARLESWMERHGRDFDQITPKESAARPVALEPAFAAACERAQQALTRGVPSGNWRVERFDSSITTAARSGMVVVFRGDAEARLMVVVLEPRDGEGPSYAQTQHFNLSYWTQWRGRPCDVDSELLEWCVGTLRGAESSTAQ
jgi:hypothetical protein